MCVKQIVNRLCERECVRVNDRVRVKESGCNREGARENVSGRDERECVEENRKCANSVMCSCFNLNFFTHHSFLTLIVAFSPLAFHLVKNNSKF